MKDRPIEASLSFRYVQVARAHRERIAAALRGLGLYVGQEMILSQLWEKEGVAQSELATACQLERPTITKVIERISEAGLIRVEGDRKDRRIRRVYLTARGKSLKKDVRKRWHLVEEQLFGGFSDGEKRELAAFLERMGTNLSHSADSARQSRRKAK